MIDADVRARIRLEVDQQFGEINSTIATLNQLVTRQNTLLDSSARAGGRAERQNKKLKNSFDGLNSSIKAFITFNISRALTQLVAGFANGIIEIDAFKLQIETLTGSAEEAERVFNDLRSSGIVAPFNELLGSFTKLESLNLDSSSASLRQFADLSAATGTSVNQLVEAFADASTFEFERLKDALGIVARQSTDSIVFTYRGVRTEVDKSVIAIQNYLKAQSEAFSGANAKRIDTIRGSLEDLRNAYDERAADSTSFIGRILPSFSTQRAITNIADSFRITENENSLVRERERLQVKLNKAQERYDRIVNSGTSEQSRKQAATVLASINEIQAELVGVVDQWVDLQKQAQEAAVGSGLRNFIATVQGSAEQLDTETSKLLPAATRFEKTVALLIEAQNTLETRALQGDDTLYAQLQTRIDDLVESIARYNNAVVESANNDTFERLQDDAARFANGVLSETQKAYATLQRGLEALPSIDRTLLATLGLDQADIAKLGQERFNESIIAEIGARVIRDGTAQIELAFKDQQEVIARLSNEGVLNASILNESVARSAEVRIAALRDSIFNQSVAGNPFQGLQTQLESLDIQIAGTTSSIEQNLLRISGENLLNDFITGGAGIDFSGNIIQQTDQLIEAISKLNSIDGVDAADTRLFTKEGLKELADSFGTELPVGISETINALEALAVAATELGLLDVAEQFRNAIAGEGRESPFDRLTAEAADFFDFITSAEEAQVSAANLSRGDWVKAYAEGFSQVIDVFGENSRKLFELNKILDASLIASNASAALANALKSGNPAIAALKVIGVIGTYGKLLKDVLDRDFGDTNIKGVNTNTLAVSDARPDSAGFEPGGFTVNVYGNVIDTQQGFRELITENVKDAAGRDEITADDFVTRRR